MDSALPLRSVPPWGVATGVSVGVVTVSVLTLSTVVRLSAEIVFAVGLLFGVQVVLFYHTNRAARVDSGRQPFTLATLVTVLRGTAIAVLAGFVVVGRPDGNLAWLPALLFGAGALFDGIDGVLARATDAVSAFGSRLDIEVDALVLLVGALVAVRIGAAPVVYVLVGLARYLFVWGVTLRRVRGTPVESLPSRTSRRVLGATQMLVVFVVLTPVLDPTYSRPLAVVAMVPFLLGFCRDWLLVSGRL